MPTVANPSARMENIPRIRVRKRGRDVAAAITSSMVRSLATGRVGSIEAITLLASPAIDNGLPLVLKTIFGVEPADNRYGMNNSVPAGLSTPPFLISATTPTTVHQTPFVRPGRTRLPMADSCGQKVRAIAA